MYIIFYLLFFTLSAVLVLLPWKLLASVCLGRQWNQRQGLVSGWVAAPAVDVQSDSGEVGSVAVVTDEIHALLCGNWCCPQTPALSPLFPLLLSPLLTRLSAVTASLQWLWSAAATSQSAGLILPAFRSCLQTSLKRRLGLPAGLVPVASSL